MLVKYSKILKIYIDNDIFLYKKSSKDRALISKYEWDNKILNYSILMEIELLTTDTAGYFYRFSKNDFSLINESISFLEKKSIYNSQIVVNWLTKDNINQYPDFYNYLMFIENFRVLALKICEELKTKGEK